jgi:hypothetical protein
MKKLLLILFVLAILLLAFPQGVMADPVNQPVIVNAQYTTAQLTFTANTVESKFPWTLVRSDVSGYNDNLNTDALVFTVDSNSPWTVVAADTSTAHKGHMIEAGTAGSHFLASLFQIRDTNTYTLDGASPVQIQTGNPVDVGFTKSIAQPLLVESHDFASSAGYTITVTFTCSNGF